MATAQNTDICMLRHFFTKSEVENKTTKITVRGNKASGGKKATSICIAKYENPTNASARFIV
ncbi:MAG: hypothetical protein RSA78_04525 [Oscillospiraceae bacterium]